MLASSTPFRGSSSVGIVCGGCVFLAVVAALVQCSLCNPLCFLWHSTLQYITVLQTHHFVATFPQFTHDLSIFSNQPLWSEIVRRRFSQKSFACKARSFCGREENFLRGPLKFEVSRRNLDFTFFFGAQLFCPSRRFVNSKFPNNVKRSKGLLSHQQTNFRSCFS